MSEENGTLKGACVKCAGRIAFPADMAGKKIACPHCKAFTPLLAADVVEGRLFYKCSCSKCWSNIKYPAEYIGQNIDCPHCGVQTTLVAPGSQSRPAAVTARPPSTP